MLATLSDAAVWLGPQGVLAAGEQARGRAAGELGLRRVLARPGDAAAGGQRLHWPRPGLLDPPRRLPRHARPGLWHVSPPLRPSTFPKYLIYLKFIGAKMS